MSAKLIYSPTDNENPDIHKQIGCMNGFFQLFDSHRRIASHERITNAQPQNRVILQPGQNGNQEVEANSGLEKAKEKDSKKAIKEKETKKVVKEKRRSSTESSSRHSFTSSSCSSSFSSLDFNNKTTNTEPSNSSQNSLTLTQFSRKSVDLRDVVKDSMRREARGLSVKTAAKEPALRTLKYLDSPRPTEGLKSSANSRPTKDLRRLSYDGGESRDGLKSRDVPRLSLDSRHGSARPSFLSDLRIENMTRNEAANLLLEPGSSKRASSVVAKLMGLVDPVPTVDEPPRLERIGPGPLSRPSIKTTRPGSQKIPFETAPWRQLKGGRGSPAKASTAPLTVFGEIEKRLADLEFKKSGKNLRALKQILEAMQKSKAAALDDKKDSRLASQESYDDDNGSNPSARSPIVIMKPARLLGRHAESASAASSVDRKKVPRNVRPVQTRKMTDVSGTTSPRLNPRTVGSDKQSYPVGPADSNIRRRNSNRQSLESSSPGRKFRPRSDRERSSESNASPLQSESNVSLASEDIDSEVTSIVQPDQNNRGVGLGTNRKTAEPGRAMPEQPSPISVLDAAFYRDESPSPVKKTSNAFKDDEVLYPDELEWAVIDRDQQSNGRKSSLVIESANPDHVYISDILSASGLKRETNVPFNPKLFFALEQRWARTLLHPKPDEKAHRKLVFDAVNEILARRRLSADKPAREGNRKLLLELCSEVDRLQGKSSGEEEDEEDKLRSVVREDMARWPMNGKEYGKEVPAVVLDVERLIFKDLVTELVTGMKTRPGLLCKQLCFN